MTFSNDTQLIHAISMGGQQREKATEFLMNAHIGFVRSLTNKLYLDEESVLDCYVDALVDVVRDIENGTFKSRSKISTYLYQIAYYRCVDRLRKTKKDIAYKYEYPELEDASQRIGRRLETESEVAHLKNHLKRLGPPCNNILMDWGFWGYSMKEIAERNGLASDKIAKSRKYQCLMQLRKLMGK